MYCNLESKLSKLADILSRWAGTISNFQKEKKWTQARLKGAQIALENDPFNPFLFDLENELNIKLQHLLDQEESYWQCRSRTDWLMLGDRNTHFFHLSTVIRRKHNRIIFIKNEVGESFTNLEDINNLFLNYYKSLFSSNTEIVAPTIVSLQQIDWSFCPTMEELKEAIFAIGKNKAPGEDGFHASFFHHFWDTIKDDCMIHVSKIFKDRKVPSCINSTIITLIPKMDNPTRVNHFRPIS